MENRKVEDCVEKNKLNVSSNEIYLKSFFVVGFWSLFYYLAYIKGYYLAGSLDFFIF